MARDEIVEKLDSFIAKHHPVTEECHVVYLLVEMRKILDHMQDHWKSGEFTVLRFYCDWAVHTSKDYPTPSMERIMAAVLEDVKAQVERQAMTEAMSPVTQFAYMSDLRAEMAELLKRQEISQVIVKDGWEAFVQLLVGVLQSQPIRRPIPEIASFSFLPAERGCLYGLIEFTTAIRGEHYYKFANRY